MNWNEIFICSRYWPGQPRPTDMAHFLWQAWWPWPLTVQYWNWCTLLHCGQPSYQSVFLGLFSLDLWVNTCLVTLTFYRVCDAALRHDMHSWPRVVTQGECCAQQLQLYLPIVTRRKQAWRNAEMRFFVGSGPRTFGLGLGRLLAESVGPGRKLRYGVFHIILVSYALFVQFNNCTWPKRGICTP